MLGAVERVLEDHDLEALGVAEAVGELVDQDAVEDAALGQAVLVRVPGCPKSVGCIEPVGIL